MIYTNFGFSGRLTFILLIMQVKQKRTQNWAKSVLPVGERYNNYIYSWHEGKLEWSRFIAIVDHSMGQNSEVSMAAAIAVCDKVASTLQLWATSRDDKYRSAARNSLKVSQNRDGDT